MLAVTAASPGATTDKEQLAVLGAGSWGTALAIHLAQSGHAVRLWARNPDHVAAMQSDRTNAGYLPDIRLPDGLQVTDSLEAALTGITTLILAVPSHALEPTLDDIKPLLADERLDLIWACKGFAGAKLLHEIVYSRFNDSCVPAVLSGPNFAAELARGLPTATTIASTSLAPAQRICAVFHHGNLRAYASDDVTGVQLGGALKNIYAIATGVSDGLGFGANTRAALITRGMAEITRLALPMGSKIETLSGLSGMGDLVLTCTDDQSRNRRYGLALGQGKTPDDALAGIGQVVEGARAVVSALELAQIHGVELPIATQVHALIYEGRSPHEAVAQILARAPVSEI